MQLYGKFTQSFSICNSISYNRIGGFISDNYERVIMRVKLLKKLRKKIRCNLSIVRNNSKFSINWTYLSVMINWELYRTDRAWGVYNENIFKVILRELEHIVLKDYVIKKRINLWKNRKI